MTGDAAKGRFCSCAEVPPRRNSTPALSDDTVDAAKSDDGTEATVLRPLERAWERFDAADDAFAAVSDSSDSTQQIDEAVPSVGDLLPGERRIDAVVALGDGAEVILTDRRVVSRGSAESRDLFASAYLAEIAAVSIARKRPRGRSLFWGLVGVLATVALWQALDGVGNLRLIVAAVSLLVSAVLLADYFIRPPDLEVVMHVRSGADVRAEFANSQTADADRITARIVGAIERRRKRRRNSARSFAGRH